MKRKLYISNYSSDKSIDFYNEALELIKTQREEEFYYILPNGKIINKYREKLVKDLGAVFSVSLFTFDDIVNNILEINPEKIIGEEIKYFIVSKILKRLKLENKLNYYKSFVDMHGFVVSIIDIIISMKKDLIRSEDILGKLPKDPKFLELGYIYKSYEDYLKEKDLFDREEVYFKAIEILDKKELKLNIKKIFIDEFYDFRPIEMKLLKSLCNLDIDIEININNLMEKDNKILQKTIDNLDKLGFQKNITKNELTGFVKLAGSLFSNVEKIEKVNVNKYEATSKYLEIKRIFEDIKKSYNKGVDFSEMVIIPLDDSYLRIIEDVIHEEKIPVNRHFDKSLLDYKISREILNILKLGLNNNFKELVLNRVSSSFFSTLEQDEKNKIYTYFKNENFANIAEFKTLLSKKTYKIKEENHILLMEVLNTINLEIEALLEINNLKGFNSYIREIFQKYNILEDIKEKLYCEFDEFREEIEIYNILDNILIKLDEFSFYENKMKLKEYIKLMEDYLKENKIRQYIKIDKGLNVLNLIDSRGFNFKNTYIVGLSQSLYPNIKDENFLYQEKNRNIIENIGLKYSTYEDRLDNEVCKISKLIASTTEKLVISYTKGENDESAESLFLDEILRNVKEYDNEKVDFQYIFKEDIKDITSLMQYKNYVLENIFKEDIIKLDYEINREKLQELNYKLSTIQSRQVEFNEFNGRFKNIEIKKEIKDRFKEYKYSATTLDNYGKCPFSFFMNYVLKLEEIYIEEGEDFLKLGNLYHNVLKEFFEIYVEKELSEVEIEHTIETIFNKYIQILEFKEQNKLDSIYIEDKKKKLKEFIYMDLNRIIEQDIKLYAFEKSFGKDKEFKIGNTNIIGKIDRIDKVQDNTIIIDYKTSRGSKLNDMQNGISFQMPIYMTSEIEANPVAGLYGILKTGEYEVGLAIDGVIPETKNIRKNKFAKKEELIEFMDDIKTQIDEIRENILEAKFDLDPKLCSEYCIYRNVCRYEGRWFYVN